jgi:hypothetical protein
MLRSVSSFELDAVIRVRLYYGRERYATRPY